MKESLYDYAIRKQMEYLLDQWDSEKNGDLTPEAVPPMSRACVWWRCDKGHTWRVEVRDRSRGRGCPVCANRAVKQGVNDLKTTHPDLAAQWHPEKNNDLTALQVTHGSKKKVWWQCRFGHEWQASIHCRASGDGCPVCAGKQIIPGENDLATLNPSVANSWHPEKNGTLKPDMVSLSSNRKAWWRCDLGHEWQATVSTRTAHQSGCPFCAGRIILPGFNDLATRFPEVAAQWHPTLNGDLSPTQIGPGSHKRVWWQCSLGHVWETMVFSRTMPKATNCPVCAGMKGNYQERYEEALRSATEKFRAK